MFGFFFTYCFYYVVCRKKPYQYLSMGKREMPTDNQMIVRRSTTSWAHNSSSAFHAYTFAIIYKDCEWHITAECEIVANCSKCSGLNDSMLTNVSPPSYYNMLPMMMTRNRPKSPNKSETLQSPPRTTYDGTSAHNVSASPSNSMERRCALDTDLRMNTSDLLLYLPSQPNDIAKPIALNSISSHIKQKHMYAIPAAEPDNVIKEQSTNDATTFINPDAIETGTKTAPATTNRPNSSWDSLNRTRLLHTQKRKVILPSPMVLTEMFKRYKQCFRQDFVMQNPLSNMKNMAKAPATDTDAHNQANIEIPVTYQQNQSSNAANATKFLDLSNSVIVVNSKSNNSCTDAEGMFASVSQQATFPPPLHVTLIVSDSIQLNRDVAQRADKVQFQSPLDPMHGAVIAILSHSTSPSENDVIVVVQESQISYWYAMAKILCMCCSARSWIRVGSFSRNVTGRYDDLNLHFLMVRMIELFFGFFPNRQRSGCTVSTSSD